MKDIKGFEGLYAITEDGKVWSYPKQHNRKKPATIWDIKQNRRYAEVAL